MLVDRRLSGDEQQIADAKALREPERLVRIGVEPDRGDVRHVEIIFFSMPTPAAIARSTSSGTVAESWSAMPVESKTVICSARLASLELAADHLADLAGDVVLRDEALAQRDVDLAVGDALAHVVHEDASALQEARVELLLALEIGAERSEVRARPRPTPRRRSSRGRACP